MVGADVFIGVSGGTVPEEVVRSMARDAIVFGLANPTPRCTRTWPTGTRGWSRPAGRDFPNQINNVLAFPGIFRGALSVRASRITPGMRLAAAAAISGVVGDDLAPDYVVPSVFDARVGAEVSRAVAAAARADGVARV